jgi:hypothetical protein
MPCEVYLSEEWNLHPEVRRLWQCLEDINVKLG